VRATDENVPQALVRLCPKVTVTASGGGQFTNQLTNGSSGKKIEEGPQGPHAVGATLTQTLFNGNQTATRPGPRKARSWARGKVCGCWSSPFCSRRPRSTWITLRDAAILEVQRSNTKVLEQTLRQTRDRYSAGLVTPTDVAQSQAQLAAGRTQELAAEATLATTRANFRRIIGNEPEQLAPGSPGGSLFAGDATRCLSVSAWWKART